MKVSVETQLVVVLYNCFGQDPLEACLTPVTPPQRDECASLVERACSDEVCALSRSRG
jgi:hypothetical protein